MTEQAQARRTTGHRRIRQAGIAAAAVGLSGVIVSGTQGSAFAAAHDPASSAAHEVGTAAYDLGDTAFKDPGTGIPMELTGVVHYPKDVRDGRRPMIVQLHGMWNPCTSQDGVWPCPAGSAALPSYRGYDYLGEELARQGYVVVSISANAVNANLLGGEGAAARAALVDKHLSLWKSLSETGKGDLAGKFTDPAGKRSDVDFTNSIDFGRVGTMGHSQGGRAVVQHASEGHRDRWPSGVDVKAVLALAPAYPFDAQPDEDGTDAFNPDAAVVNSAFAVVSGTCDGAVGTTGATFLDDARKAGNTAGMHDITVHGANHNYFNTQWSPSSRQAHAEDDAMKTGPGGRSLPTGHCRPHPQHDVNQKTYRQLSETGQRKIATTYISAFFQRYVSGEKKFDAILSGKEHPLSDIGQVDAHTRPAGRSPAPAAK
ncbi:alpha/beta hydrolase [Streptomyces gamaensis]|uniref:Alpha/beta hydrolase n=1 Tax=Streptomyces gamaensis TaxID=1763542 RepID=A0ABW0ZAN0_9ACTN